MLVEIGSTRGKFLYHRAGRSHDRITEYLRQRHKARKAKTFDRGVLSVLAGEISGSEVIHRLVAFALELVRFFVTQAAIY